MCVQRRVMFYKMSILFFLPILFISCGMTKEYKFQSTFKEQVSQTRDLVGLSGSARSFLFVVDTSGSMREEIKHFASNIQILADFLESKASKNIDYNFAIATMDVITNPSVKVLKSPLSASFISSCGLVSQKENEYVRKTHSGNFLQFPAQNSTLYDKNVISCVVGKYLTDVAVNINEIVRKSQAGSKSYVSKGTGESYFEPLFELIRRSTDVNDETKKSFFSLDTDLVIIFISDAAGGDLYMKNKAIPNFSFEYSEKIYNYILQTKGDTRFRAYGVIPVDRTDCGGIFKYDDSVKTPRSGSVLHFPRHAQQFIRKTNGQYFPMCLRDWGSYLTGITQDLEDFFQIRPIYLEDIPDLDTIEVFYAGEQISQDPETGWSYNIETNAIILGDLFRNFSESEKGVLEIRYYPFNPKAVIREFE